MTNESRAFIRLRLLGRALFVRDARAADRALRQVNGGARQATRGLRAVRGDRAAQSLKHIAPAAASARSALARLATGAALLAGGGGLIGAVSAGADFEQQLANVQSRLMTTGANMSKLKRLALDLGAKTNFSAAQAAGGMDELAAAGFTTRQILNTLPGTLALAAASGTDLADSAELQGAAIRGFGLKAADAQRVADVLALTVNKSALEMSDLADTLPYVASTARQTGSSFEEVAAAAGILGNAGIKGSMAGTALRTSMLRLTDPSEKMYGAFGRMGLSAKALAAVPLPEVIGRVAKGLKKLPSRGEKVGAISAIFGKEAAPSMLNLMAKGRAGIDRFTRALKHSSGAAKRAADIQRNTVKGAFDNLQGSIETVAISLTSRFNPALKSALNRAAGGVNKLSGFGNAFLTGLSGPRASRRIGATPLGQAHDPTRHAAKPPERAEALGAVVREKAGAALGFIKGKVLPGVADVGGQVIDALKPAMPFLEGLVPLLQGVGEGVLGGIVATFKIALPIIKVAATALGWVGTHVLKPMAPVLRIVGIAIGVAFGPGVLGKVAKVVGAFGKVGGIVGGVIGRIGKILGGVGPSVGKAVGGFKRVAGALGTGLTWARRYVGFMGGLPGRVGRLAVNMAGRFVNGAERLWGWFRALPGKLGGKLRSLAGSVGDLAAKVGKAIVDGIVGFIRRAPGAVMDAIMSLVPDKARGPVKTALGFTPAGLAVKGINKLTGRATGGVVRPGELTLVGERGPEIARFPSGTRVSTAAQTRRAMRAPQKMLAPVLVLHVRPEVTVRQNARGQWKATVTQERLAHEAA